VHTASYRPHKMETLLSRKEVARTLGVSVMTITRREAAGFLNPIRFGDGRVIRYKLSDIERCLEENKLRR
jgi:predicted site-specific integrase-resolvase